MVPIADILPGSKRQDDPALVPLRLQEPIPDLYDELNRIIPFCYLNDFKSPSRYPGRNLGAIAFQDEIGPQPSSGIRIGEWYYPVGAARWSVFRGLATSTMAKQMLAATQGRLAKPFVMKALPISPDNPQEADYTLTSNMYMLPPRPMAEHGKCFDGLYLITLVDERYYWQNTPATLRITKDSTWAGLISQLSTLLGVTIGYSAIPSSYATPEPDSQLWTNLESAPILLDAVAHNIGRVVVRNLDGTYDLPTPAESQADVIANRGQVIKVVRMAGGDMFNSGTFLPIGNLFQAKNAIVPDLVRITFPKYIQGDDPVPHMVNPRYQNQRPSCWYEESYGDTFVVDVPLASGGPLASGVSGQVNDYTIHTTAKALYSGEAQAVSGGNPVNLSGVRALARQIAEDYYGWQLGAALDEVYPGTFSWTMEGFHDIIWTYSERLRLASTRAVRSEWNQTIREMQHSAPALSGETNVPRGVGGPSVAQTWRDQNSGYAVATLSDNLASGGFTATFSDVGGYPTQNRWRGQIDNEVMLFEGTSGGTSVGIVYRGIDGTLQAAHAAGRTITQLFPHTAYGVNLVTAEKMQWIFPGIWSSGGISEIVIVPQTQSVYIYSASGAQFNGGTVHYSGRVLTYDAASPALLPFSDEELIWVVERNGDPVLSGKRYDGQFAGFSQSGSVSPVYLVNAAGSGLGGGGAGVNSGSLFWYHFAACGLSGVNCSGWIPETFLMSGLVKNPLLDGNHHTDTVSGTPSKGYLIVGNSGKTWEGFAIGSPGDVLIADPTQLFGIRWGPAPPPSGPGPLLDPTVHTDTVLGAPDRGAFIVGNSGNEWQRFSVGANDTIPVADNTQLQGIQWRSIGSGLISSGTIINNGYGTDWDAFYQVVSGTRDSWYAAGGPIAEINHSFVPVSGRVYAMPFLITTQLMANKMMIKTGGANLTTSKARLGIYKNTSFTDLKPSSLLVAMSGPLILAAANYLPVEGNLPANTTLDPGLYWILAFCGDAGGNSNWEGWTDSQYLVFSKIAGHDPVSTSGSITTARSMFGNKLYAYPGDTAALPDPAPTFFYLSGEWPNNDTDGFPGFWIKFSG
jgi:hypothetical protein